VKLVRPVSGKRGTSRGKLTDLGEEGEGSLVGRRRTSGVGGRRAKNDS
jgi:hypothetical protein